MTAEAEKKPELVIGFVAPLGVDLEGVERIIRDLLNQFGYESGIIRLSGFIKNLSGLNTVLDESSPGARISTYMSAGNEARKKFGQGRPERRGELLAAMAILEIARKRDTNTTKKFSGCAYLLHSLKHPDEVRLLREVYQQGLFLIGVSSSKENRLKHLIERKGVNSDEADRLILRDESEEDKHGQHTRETFHLADAFVNGDSLDLTKDLRRIFDLLFGFPYATPTRDEYAMFMAFSAALRSSDLSRQVGAVIMSSNSECLATGANDVPRYPGGLYWSGDETDSRDHIKGFDSNENTRNEMIVKIMKRLVNEREPDGELLARARQDLANTGIFDITEFGRAVHAEMEALLSCARIGVSTRGASLFSTTFPCHNCAKHIVAAGITRVVFVEPYPKSQALRLHEDSIIFVETPTNSGKNKVAFEPFVGVGPRKYIDLFSMELGGGAPLRRKENGLKASWERKKAKLRFPMLPVSYIEIERLRTRDLLQQMEVQNGDR
jgi:deoxycytidylate deaminase